MAFWNKSKKAKVDNSKNSDDYKDFVDDSHLDNEEETKELEALRIIEIVAKDNQLTLRDVKDRVKTLIEFTALVGELREEIKLLKAELRDEKNFNRELINKLIDKPAAPSASDRLSAIRAANNGGGFGAIEKAAAKK